MSLSSATPENQWLEDECFVYLWNHEYAGSDGIMSTRSPIRAYFRRRHVLPPRLWKDFELEVQKLEGIKARVIAARGTSPLGLGIPPDGILRPVDYHHSDLITIHRLAHPEGGERKKIPKEIAEMMKDKNLYYKGKDFNRMGKVKGHEIATEEDITWLLAHLEESSALWDDRLKNDCYRFYYCGTRGFPISSCTRIWSNAEIADKLIAEKGYTVDQVNAKKVSDYILDSIFNTLLSDQETRDQLAYYAGRAGRAQSVATYPVAWVTIACVNGFSGGVTRIV